MSTKKQKHVQFHNENLEYRVDLLETRMQELNDIFQMLLDLDSDGSEDEEDEEEDEEEMEDRRISFSFCMCDEDDEDDEDEDEPAFFRALRRKLRKEY